MTLFRLPARVLKSTLPLLILVFFAGSVLAQSATQQQRAQMQLRALQQDRAGTQATDVPGLDRAERELIRDVRALEEPVDPLVYVVGPGDFFTINIVSIENVLVTLPVGPTGDLMIPNVGTVPVAGLILSDAVEAIRERVSRRVIDGDIFVSLERLRTFRAYVYGAVNEPGFVEITPMLRVSDILDRVTPRTLALLNEIRVIHFDGSLTTIDLFEFKLAGDRSQNIRLREGDQVFIPFGRIGEHTVSLRGSLTEGAGYTILRPDETLREFLSRKAMLAAGADLDAVTVIRSENDGQMLFSVTPPEMDDFVLQAGDEIQLIGLRSVNVHGYVASPGSFGFIPGFTAGDYVSLAGGLLPVGTLNRLKVTRLDGTVLRGEDVVIQRGDVIEVSKSVTGTLFGDVSVLSILTAAATITLAAVAAFRR